MGTRSLLLGALAAIAAVTLLRGEMGGTRTVTRAPGTRREMPAAAPTAAEDPQAADTPESTGFRVLDAATGSPVADARVTFYRALWRTRTAEPVASVTTDGSGRFEPPEEVSPYRLVVDADGYPPTPFDLDEDEKDLRLGRGKVEEFAIRDESGRPGAGAQVDVFGDSELLLRLYTEEADARGRLTLWLSGKERTLVRLEGYGYEEMEGPELVLKRGYSVGGKVVDSAGRPVGGARVTVWQGSG